LRQVLGDLTAIAIVLTIFEILGLGLTPSIEFLALGLGVARDAVKVDG